MKKIILILSLVLITLSLPNIGYSQASTRLISESEEKIFYNFNKKDFDKAEYLASASEFNNWSRINTNFSGIIRVDEIAVKKFLSGSDGIETDERPIAVYYTIKNGKKDGPAFAFVKNGSLTFITNYKNGKKDGIEKLFYFNGTVNSIVKYSNGKFIAGKCYNGDYWNESQTLKWQENISFGCLIPD